MVKKNNKNSGTTNSGGGPSKPNGPKGPKNTDQNPINTESKKEKGKIREMKLPKLNMRAGLRKKNWRLVEKGKKKGRTDLRKKYKKICQIGIR